MMLISFALLSLLQLLPHASAEKVTLELFGNMFWEKPWKFVEKVIICLGPNGFNFPMGNWDGPDSFPTLSGAMTTMTTTNPGECRKWDIGNGFDIGPDTFCHSSFTAVICGRKDDYSYITDIFCFQLFQRIQCDEGQVLAMWYKRPGYADCVYNLVQGNYVKHAHKRSFEGVIGVTLADELSADVIISPENMMCTIEHSKATCHPFGAEPVEPATSPPTAPPSVENTGDETSTSAGSNGETGIGGDKYEGGMINVNIEEEKGCGSECIGAIASVAGVVITILAMFVKYLQTKKKNGSNDANPDQQGSKADISASKAAVPLGGPTPMAGKQKQKRKKPVVKSDETSHTSEADSTESQHVAEDAPAPASGTKNLSTLQDGSPAPAAGSLSPSRKQKKKKKKRASREGLKSSRKSRKETTSHQEIEKLKALRVFVGNNDNISESDLSTCLRQAGYVVEIAAERILTGQFQPSQRKKRPSPNTRQAETASA